MGESKTKENICHRVDLVVEELHKLSSNDKLKLQQYLIQTMSCSALENSQRKSSLSSTLTFLKSKFYILFKLLLFPITALLGILKLILPGKLSISNCLGLFFSVLSVIFYFQLHTSSGFTRMWLRNVDLNSVECTIQSPDIMVEIFRPPVSCEFCRNLKSVDVVSKIPSEDFERWYAYTGRPVVVKDAMINWTAPSTFSFEFLKSIYSESSRSLTHMGEDCLFFPYQTEFQSLGEVFNMSQQRARERWYIGWSNCDAESSHILRQHYQRPYFLPPTAETPFVDWIFMGTGQGAHMHIDNVLHGSWQGQVKGRKRWILKPPTECLYQCHALEVEVQPGSIIVFNSNTWYHQTFILPGDISIAIGAEYD